MGAIVCRGVTVGVNVGGGVGAAVDGAGVEMTAGEGAAAAVK